MNQITLTKNITKGDELVVISRKEYDRVLVAYEKLKWHQKEREAHDDILKGRLSKGYTTKKELRAALDKLKK
ncbi:MAG TPA: hypothetical protein VI981_00970 [Candidatus Paceibacterota bacterium]